MNANNHRPHSRAGIRSGIVLAALLGGAVAFLILPCGTGLPSPLDAGSPPAAARSQARHVTLYDADPAHLWNRLHSALFVRTAVDGRRYGEDELDPLLWPRSKHLLAGERHKRVVVLLDELLARDGHKLIKDPLKRAVLQHDLWAVLDWLANPTAPYRYRDDDCTPEARALQVRLARAIRRLALPAEDIRRLPDNYAAALAARPFATCHDPKKPARAFLPADLFAPDGPWVVLGEHMAPAAPAHVRAVHARSAFFVLMNLPAGRKATLAYLERLAAYPNPLMAQPTGRHAAFLARNLPLFNPELPQFPVGTQVALVRELLAIDDRGKIRPTRLIESVQFRVYREIPKGDLAHPQGFDDLVGKQDFYELRITRKALFAGTAGGLRAVRPRDEEIPPFFNPGPDDPFEEDPPTRPGTSRTMALCSGCHSRPGIHSVEAYRRGFVHLPQPAHLRADDRGQQELAAMRRKWEDYSWGLLQGLLDRD
jgi:hypothetical protein